MCAKCTVFIFVIFHTYKIIPVKLWRAQRPWHRCAEHIVSPPYANHRFWTVLPAICVGLLVRLRHKAKGINCSICICMTTHVCRPRNVCDEHGLLSLNSTSSTWHATWPLVVSSSNLNRANKNWTISQCRPICLLYLQKLTPDVMKHQSQTDKYSKKQVGGTYIIIIIIITRILLECRTANSFEKTEKGQNSATRTQQCGSQHRDLARRYEKQHEKVSDRAFLTKHVQYPVDYNTQFNVVRLSLGFACIFVM